MEKIVNEASNNNKVWYILYRDISGAMGAHRGKYLLSKGRVISI